MYGDDNAGSSFRIRGAGTARLRGLTVRVALKGALPQTRTAWVAYDRGDEASPLRGAAGRAVADIGAFAATALKVKRPVARSGSVSGAAVTLYFDEVLDVGWVPAGRGVHGEAHALGDVRRRWTSAAASPVAVSRSVVDADAEFEAAHVHGQGGRWPTPGQTGAGARPLKDMSRATRRRDFVLPNTEEDRPLTNEGPSAPAGAPAYRVGGR